MTFTGQNSSLVTALPQPGCQTHITQEAHMQHPRWIYCNCVSESLFFMNHIPTLTYHRLVVEEESKVARFFSLNETAKGSEISPFTRYI